MSKVIVYLDGADRKFEYEGNFDAQLTPNNALIIVESSSVTDIQGKTAPPVIVAMYNSDMWRRITVE